jgi:hypothetical protein
MATKRATSDSTRFTAVKATADRVYKELKAFTDERRITSSARRLTALPSEAVFATTLISGGGLATTIAMGMLHIVGIFTVAGLALPLSMTACGGAGVLMWRALRARFDQRTPLDIIRDEIQQLESDDKAPKSYRDALYRMRQQALTQRLGLASPVEPLLLKAATKNIIDVVPEELASASRPDVSDAAARHVSIAEQ